ncbi:unnamed protein product [Rhizoctonia solani]|uniref:F-box domain-containing protein n=1 Tax=Rhizoctonia solani TaxID=456999 RepID=A0A8H3CU76_9AGAM|nr:unnamed protein product [Rhizoctonia solani]
MGAGYFAYRYKRKYYRRYLSCDAHPSGHGQRFADAIPRDLSILEEWIANRIQILENAKISHDEVVHPDLPEADCSSDLDDGALGYELCKDADWTFVGLATEYTYVIDLDNLVFTVNGWAHLKLNNMPPSKPGLKAYFDADEEIIKVPPQYLSTEVDLWPAPSFDVEERQRQYEALNPIVIPATEWGALPWDRLSFPQRFSIDLTHHLLSETSRDVTYAYTPYFQKKTGEFCWNILCAATSSVPLSCDVISTSWHDNSLSPRSPDQRHRRLRPHGMLYDTGAETKLSSYDRHYCWIRNCLITFCIRLGDPAYVAHEVEQMVRKMRRDGHTECVGLILSSQREVVIVAVNEGPGGARQVRHTPALNICPCCGPAGQASEGLLLMVHMLSPILTVPQLPWRASRSRPSSHVLLWPKLPVEVFQHIIRYTSTVDYVALCRVSRSIRSVCLTNPRYADFTILNEMSQYEMTYAAQYAYDDAPTVLTLYWECPPPDFPSRSRWNAWEYPELGGSEGSNDAGDGSQAENEE